jgi:hypothetical protein
VVVAALLVFEVLLLIYSTVPFEVGLELLAAIEDEGVTGSLGRVAALSARVVIILGEAAGEGIGSSFVN